MKVHSVWPMLLTLALVFALPALADTRIEKEFPFSSGGVVAVDVEGASVEVNGVSGATVRLVVTSSRDDFEAKYDLTFKEEAGRLEIVAKRKEGSSFFRWGSSGNLRFDIEVPVSTALDIETSGGSLSVEGTEGNVRLDTSGGSISVHDVRGSLRVDTSGGSISIEDIEGNVAADTSGGSVQVASVRGSLRADTSGGSVSVAEVSGDVSVETSGGSIRISEAGGRVEAETSGGSIEASFAAGNARGGSLEASGGGVRVTLDPSVGLEIDAAASGGSVASSLTLSTRGEGSKTKLSGKLGSGGETLTLRSSGGSVRIDAR